MHRPKVPNSGWAAFDRRWRGTNGSRDEGDADSFPALSDSRASNSSGGTVTDNIRLKPFASVAGPSADYAAVGNEIKNNHLTDQVENANYVASSALDKKLKLLKDAHCWADSTLIQDVLAAADNDVDQASAYLEAMVDPDLLAGEGRTSDQLAVEMNKTYGSSSENAITNNRHPDGSYLLVLPTNLSSIPVEPELEELDDDYLNHRKGALKMMRAATKHSQAASNAFLRGDHAAAKELSLRAQEERAAAEKLNNKAAEEIFRLRNSNNDIWKIDMHGLHASEAIAVLERHLHMIEFQQPGNCAASTDELAKLESACSESIPGSNIKFSAEKVVLRRPKQAILHVITGIGKHSKGQASLPVAVRSFLIENGYRFEELRPGVFAVRPKFRHR